MMFFGSGSVSCESIFFMADGRSIGPGRSVVQKKEHAPRSSGGRRQDMFFLQ